MANTFKVVNFAAEPASSGTPYVVYTAASSTTTIILGLVLSNISTSQVTATVTLDKNSGDDVELITNAPIPAGSSLELLAGNKVVMETSDALKVSASGATDVCLSIMEIT